ICGPGLPAFDHRGWSLWAEELSDAVLDALSDACSRTTRPVRGEVRSARVRVALSEILDGDNPPDRAVVFQRLSVGSLFDIIAMSAEPSTLLREQVSFRGATPVGYLGDVFGYWPTERQRIEGGYEAHHFIPNFGLFGRFRPGLDERFRAAIAGLAELS